MVMDLDVDDVHVHRLAKPDKLGHESSAFMSNHLGPWLLFLLTLHTLFQSTAVYHG
jgi:hypothetical protein